MLKQFKAWCYWCDNTTLEMFGLNLSITDVVVTTALACVLTSMIFMPYR